MIVAPKSRSALYNDDGDFSGAQTERRGYAGPVRSLLGGKDLTGHFLHSSNVKSQMAVCLKKSFNFRYRS
jgi:hypothetical protein